MRSLPSPPPEGPSWVPLLTLLPVSLPCLRKTGQPPRGLERKSGGLGAPHQHAVWTTTSSLLRSQSLSVWPASSCLSTATQQLKFQVGRVSPLARPHGATGQQETQGNTSTFPTAGASAACALSQVPNPSLPTPLHRRWLSDHLPPVTTGRGLEPARGIEKHKITLQVKPPRWVPSATHASKKSTPSPRSRRRLRARAGIASRTSSPL